MGSLFGSKKTKLKPINLNAGGIRTSGSSTITATASPERQRIVGSISATFPQQAAELAALRAQVRPGFGALRASRLAGVEGARSRAVGDLRENLARRRVLGSNFAQDAITRANLEFEREADRVRAESFLQELDLSQQLLSQEMTARRGEAQTLLDELNLQIDVAGSLASEAGANARMQAQLDAQSASGFGALVGKIAGFALAPFTGGASAVPAAVGLF